MTAYLYDLETTSADPEKAKPVQAAAIAFDIDPNGVVEDPSSHNYQYYDAGEESSNGALAVHGISRHEVLAREDYIVATDFSTEDVAPGMTYMVGHNIGYDYKVAGEPPNIKTICTLKIIRNLFPEWDSHTLGATALYAAEHYLGDKGGMLQRLREAHDARWDVLINLDVLRFIVGTLKIQSLDDLWFQYNQTLRYPTVFSFGKHKGRRIAEIAKEDRGYCGWILRQPDMDADVVTAVSRSLG